MELRKLINLFTEQAASSGRPRQGVVGAELAKTSGGQFTSRADRTNQAKVDAALGMNPATGKPYVAGRKETNLALQAKFKQPQPAAATTGDTTADQTQTSNYLGVDQRTANARDADAAPPTQDTQSPTADTGGGQDLAAMAKQGTDMRVNTEVPAAVPGSDQAGAAFKQGTTTASTQDSQLTSDQLVNQQLAAQNVDSRNVAFKQGKNPIPSATAEPAAEPKGIFSTPTMNTGNRQVDTQPASAKTYGGGYDPTKVKYAVDQPKDDPQAVKGGFGQTTNIRTDTPDQIARRGPFGMPMKEEEEEGRPQMQYNPLAKTAMTANKPGQQVVDEDSTGADVATTRKLKSGLNPGGNLPRYDDPKYAPTMYDVDKANRKEIASQFDSKSTYSNPYDKDTRALDKGSKAINTVADFEEGLNRDLAEMLRLSGLPLYEKVVKLEAAPPQAGAVGAFGKNPNVPPGAAATPDAAPTASASPSGGGAVAAFGKTAMANAPGGTTSPAAPAPAQNTAAPAAPAAPAAARPQQNTAAPASAGGYAQSAQPAAAPAPAAARPDVEAQKKGMFATAAAQPVNNQSSGMTAQSQAQDTKAASAQATAPTSSGYTAQSQVQKSPTAAPAAPASAAATPAAAPAAAQTSDQIATAALNAPNQGTSGTSLGIQGGFGKMAEEEELEEELKELEELAEMMRLSGLLLNEKAVSKQQQKFMGMVHAMQKGERVKGASPELKKVAKSMGKRDVKDFAKTKHKGLPQKVTEGLNLMLDEGGHTLNHIVNRYKHEVKKFLDGDMMSENLYDALYDYYLDRGDMPYGVAKAREGDPYAWTVDRFYNDITANNMNEAPVYEVAGDDTLHRLAELAGLNESRVDECDDMSMDTKDRFNVSTNMSSDGTRSVNISAQGDRADALLQMLKMAGMRPHDDHDNMAMSEPTVVMLDRDKELEEEKKRVTRHANTPDEEYQTVSSITRQGNDLNREKKQFAGKPRLGDNPMAEGQMEFDRDLVDLLDSILIKKDMEEDSKSQNPYPVGQDALSPQEKLNPTNNPNKSIVRGIKDFIMNPTKPGM